MSWIWIILIILTSPIWIMIIIIYTMAIVLFVATLYDWIWRLFK